MQFLKEELRVKILESAKNEFHDKGYGKASMRTIAKHSGITVGNIYRYFDGKEALFEAVVREAYERFYEVFNTKIVDSILIENREDQFEQMRAHIIEALVTCVEENRVELLILLRGAQGTKYESMKEDFHKVLNSKVILRFKHCLKGTKNVDKIDFMSNVVTASCIDGLIEAIITYDDSKVLKEVMELIYDYYFLNFEIRFSHLSKN